MAKSNFEKKFYKYNPVQIKRCPNGRSKTKNILHKYATAAVNLYGCIPIDDLVDIYNQQNEDMTNSTELYDLILSFVHKKEEYFFYKKHLINFSLFDNEQDITDLISEQLTKPRYIPDKDQFLKHADYYYGEQVDYLLAKPIYIFLDEMAPTRNDNFSTLSFIRNAIYEPSAMSIIFDELDVRGYHFRDEDHVNQFLQVIQDYMNSKRIWNNNAYTPRELRDMEYQSGSDPSNLHTHIHFGDIVVTSEKCYCKSGRTFEMCCMNESDTKTAKLSKREAQLFYDIWYGLLEFVAKRMDIMPLDVQIDFSDDRVDIFLKPVRDALWRKPQLIDEYINTSKLTAEKKTILESWRDYYYEGFFFIIAHTADFSVFANMQKEYDLIPFFGIKGISNSISDNLPYEIPIIVQAVILPFKDHLVYDTYLGKSDVELFSPEAKEEFNDDLLATMKEKGIIVNFNKQHNKRILN